VYVRQSERVWWCGVRCVSVLSECMSGGAPCSVSGGMVSVRVCVTAVNACGVNPR